MKTSFLTLCLLCILCSCSASDDVEPITPPTPPPSTSADVEYDDGTKYIINVKIAFDKKGWQSRKPEYYREMLKKQWEQITRRFNECDKKKQLKRKYEFIPDLEDILTFDGISTDWGTNGTDKQLIKQMDKSRFQLLVMYDCYYEPEKGEHGGGCGTTEGISTVLVIQANTQSANKYFNHLEDKITMRAITHEMGHFRGAIDIYNNILQADKNQVNKQAHTPISCIMNDIAYNETESSYWSDYTLKVLNKTGNKKIVDIITRTMYDNFPNKLILKVTEKDRPIAATVKFYPMDKKEIKAAAKWEYPISASGKTLDAKPIFYPFGNDWWKYSLILLEATKPTGEKAYAWVNDYELHNTGLDGKQEHEVIIKF